MDEFKCGLKYKIPEFPKKFTDIVYLAIGEISWNVNNDIVFRLFSENILTTNLNTIRINFWYELVQERYQFIFYQCKKILIPDNSFKNIFPKEVHSKLICYRDYNILPEYVKCYKISNNIKHVEKQFKSKLNLYDDYNNKVPCFFFGMYSDEDYNNLLYHKGEKHLIFGGSDLDYNMYHSKIIIPKIKNLQKNDKNLKIYYISANLKLRGNSIKLKGSLVKLNLVPNNWYRIVDIDNFKKHNCIYCYTGCNKLGKLYNYELLLKLEKELPEFNFIYSHSLNVDFVKMYEIYSKCFVGVRLTNKDGNANTVLEMGSLGLPIIFNGDDCNAIRYEKNNINDIKEKILIIKNLS